MVFLVPGLNVVSLTQQFYITLEIFYATILPVVYHRPYC